MKYLLCFFFLLAGFDARAGTMTLRDYRWTHLQTGQSVYVGQHLVGNMNRPDVVGAVQSTMNQWTVGLNGPTFIAYDDGNQVYPQDFRDYKNAVWWDVITDCALGKASCYTSSDTYYKRVEEMDVVLSPGGNGCQWGNYCWYDCQYSHAPMCNASEEYDVQSVLLHEWGHGIVGLEHYSPCSWSQSLMFASSESGCARHRTLGSVDNQYVGLEFDGIRFDLSEPTDDRLDGATDLGTMSWNGDQVQAMGHTLPGKDDIDFYRVYVNPEQGCRIVFYVIPYDMTDLRFVIYKDYGFVREVDSHGPGGDESWEEEATSGWYWVGVFTDNHLAGGEYGVVLQLYKPVASVDNNTVPRDPKVVVMGARVVGADLLWDDILGLYDASGRLLNSWDVPARRSWQVSINGLGLSSGVYFAKLSRARSGHKLVVVR